MTSLSLQPRGEIAAIPDRRCETMEELDATPVPCEYPSLWAPDDVVRSFFLLKHWEQEGYRDDAPRSACHLALYRHDGGKWRVSDLQEWCGEPMLDMGADGSAWVQAQADGGCCASANESSDMATFTDVDSSRFIFDEWSQFHNRDYDVSFFTDNARIAPKGKRVAYTIRASAPVTEEPRVSPDGRPDTLELASIRRSLADLPIVEVSDVQRRPALLQRLTHCVLVGWMGDSEILVVEKRRLVAVDVETGQRRASGIEVRDERDVLLVRR
jgi:hypothetical protein